MSIYGYRAAAVSDPGPVKKRNEDSYILRAALAGGEQILFALVADGMGGLSDGDLASLVVKRAFETWFLLDLPQLLEKDSFEEELAGQWQAVIFSENEKLNAGPCASGTTLTALLLFRGRFFTANIGDSRIYRLSGGQLYQLTVDHSWAQEALSMGIDPGQIERDPRRNSLTRCIGAGLSGDPDTDYTSGTFTCGDVFLLCSDGLRHLVSVSEIREILESETLSTQEKGNLLVNTAKERHERDNITAVIVSCCEGDGKASENETKRAEAAREMTDDRTVKLDMGF